MNGGLPQETKLIFLIGAPRSGTTWLQLMLSASPDIATAPETHLFDGYTRSLFSSWRRYSALKGSTGIHEIIDESEFYSLIHELVANPLAHILSKMPGSRVILEKTPAHALCWRDILAVFPNACFLHLIRDPRAVVASLRAAGRGWGARWASPKVHTNCRLWMSYISAARQISGVTDNYLEVRYEDLKTDGVHTLQAVFTWCGIEVSEMELVNILQQHEIGTLRSAEASSLAQKYAGSRPEFFRKGEIDSWREDLSYREIAFIEHFAGDLMAELGYARATNDATHRQPLVSLPTALMDRLCDGLAWRLRKYSDTLSRRR